MVRLRNQTHLVISTIDFEILSGQSEIRMHKQNESMQYDNLQMQLIAYFEATEDNVF